MAVKIKKESSYSFVEKEYVCQVLKLLKPAYENLNRFQKNENRFKGTLMCDMVKHELKLVYENLNRFQKNENRFKGTLMFDMVKHELKLAYENLNRF